MNKIMTHEEIMTNLAKTAKEIQTLTGKSLTVDQLLVLHDSFIKLQIAQIESNN